MAGGLAALLDDVAVIAKMASAAGTKAAAVVVDDAAVTPQYVRGFDPKRELPIIWRITRGSLLNKAILIAVLLLLDTFLPIVLVPMLMMGGLYLCYEGAEKIWEKVSGHHAEATDEPAAEQGPAYEKTMVRSAITTDFVLSAEIMMISLNAINDSAATELPIWQKLITLIIVGIFITLLVYGAVALIVKLDDIGLSMIERRGESKLGEFLVDLMPRVLSVLSTVGVAAMLWVGGHILIDGVHKLGWHLLHDVIHHLTEPIMGVAVVGGFLAWLVDALVSAIVGLAIGAIVVVIMHLIPIGAADDHAPHPGPHAKKPAPKPGADPGH